MTTSSLIEGRDSHQAMNARLGCEQPVGIFTFNSECNAFQSRFLSRLIVDNLRLEAALLGPLEIHAQEHLGPVLRFSAARSRMDRAYCIERVVIAGQQH